jgi:hypothetical protein
MVHHSTLTDPISSHYGWSDNQAAHGQSQNGPRAFDQSQPGCFRIGLTNPRPKIYRRPNPMKNGEITKIGEYEPCGCVPAFPLKDEYCGRSCDPKEDPERDGRCIQHVRFS